MGVVRDVKKFGHSYCRKGGKINRRQQLRRMLAFAKFCEGMGCSEFENIGDRQVIAYWKSLRHLSCATLYSHWRALCLLWEMAGKHRVPPKPNPKSAQKNVDVGSSLSALD